MKLKHLVVAIVLASFAVVSGRFAFFKDKINGADMSHSAQVELEDVEGFVGGVKKFSNALKRNITKILEEYIKKD